MMKQACLMMKLHATHGKANNIVEEYLAEDTVRHPPIISTIQRVPYCPRTLEGGTCDFRMEAMNI